ncbi:hypothetical protein D623_10027736 [Myotis brandtii]|uniref:Uncharacterized protein n=1 Tax=Myotis brandtii TaxID=109478 RepID=S7N4E5_MYOBR|nr:hypothetical protein D623_10027736 [Myotis brandtii]
MQAPQLREVHCAVWRCCQPRGERLDNYSPRGGGRRQGLSTSTAFGGSPQLGGAAPPLGFCVACAPYTRAAIAVL